jgi:two-component system, OmpR family, sensor kinase
MTRLSLRLRLTVWYGFALLGALCLFGVIVVWQQSRIGIRRVDRELDAAAATLANVMQDELSEIADPVAAAAEAQRTMSVPGRPTVILDAGGTVLAASSSAINLQGGVDAFGGLRAWTKNAPGGAWRMHSRSLSVGDRTFTLLIAAPLTEVFRERREALEAMWIGIPIALLLAAGGGWWLAAVGLRPIAAMARRAATLAPSATEDLGESERRDELGQFARAFNGLVARLQQSLQTQRQFMADASHELRTPVSVIRSAADVILSRAHREESDYREALDIVGGQARRLGRLVEDMLVLARADAGGYPLQRTSLYLNEVVADCHRVVDVVARQRDVSLLVSAPRDVAFCGDEDLLKRLVLNVLQNAVQYTRRGSVVRVDLVPNGRQVSILVSDAGHGIPEADRARIFNRFVRLDASRREAGAGLGLPIARWIAEAHEGALELETSGPDGSTFRIVLPLAESAA